MKARRKSDSEIIEVEAAVYNLKNGKPYHKCLSDGHHYPASDLDFNVDAEDSVIQGWVCRDKVRNEPFTSDLFIVLEKPTRVEEWGKWCDCGDYIELDSTLFPDLTWESDPLQVEIIIKRKKK